MNLRAVSLVIGGIKCSIRKGIDYEKICALFGDLLAFEFCGLG